MNKRRRGGTDKAKIDGEAKEGGHGCTMRLSKEDGHGEELMQTPLTHV